MDKAQSIATWVAMEVSAFCGECTLSHKTFLEMDDKYGLLHYLFDNYELLHYYPNESVTEYLITYIESKGGNLCYS